MWKVASSNSGFDKCAKHEESGAEVIVFGISGDDYSVDVNWTHLTQRICDYLNDNDIQVVPDGERKLDV